MKRSVRVVRWLAASGFAAMILVPAAPLAAQEAAPASSPSSLSTSSSSEYLSAMRSYRNGDWAAAAAAFSRVIGEDAKEPWTLKSRYFLARCEMKLGRWKEASEELMTIYGLAPAFYKEWSCDFLLGECRKALGLG